MGNVIIPLGSSFQRVDPVLVDIDTAHGSLGSAVAFAGGPTSLPGYILTARGSDGKREVYVVQDDYSLLKQGSGDGSPITPSAQTHREIVEGDGETLAFPIVHGLGDKEVSVRALTNTETPTSVPIETTADTVHQVTIYFAVPPLPGESFIIRVRSE